MIFIFPPCFNKGTSLNDVKAMRGEQNFPRVVSIRERDKRLRCDIYSQPSLFADFLSECIYRESRGKPVYTKFKDKIDELCYKENKKIPMRARNSDDIRIGQC